MALLDGRAVEQRVTKAIGEEASAARRGRVCIVSRNQIENVTRAPRFAKALVDAGYDVTVMALASPNAELRAMCPEVEYIEVQAQPKSGDLLNKLKKRERAKQVRLAKRRQRYQAAAGKWNLRALTVRAEHVIRVAATGLVRPLAWPAWRCLVVAPCALLLKKQQGFAHMWRLLVDEDAVAIAIRFVRVVHRWSITHAFAERADEASRHRRFDVVQAYDNYALIAGARLARRDHAKLIYDAVEITSHRLAAAMDWSLAERLREWLERREESRIFCEADAVITVGDGVAKWYASHYRLRVDPLVVKNCRYYWPHEPDQRLRKHAQVGPDVRLVMWCGLIYPQAGLELIINALPRMEPHIHLVIVGLFNPAQKIYAEQTLPMLAASLGVSERLHMLPARTPTDLIPYISGADIGVIPRPSEHLNNFYSMPNKFLEMVMARLPVAVSRLGDIVDVINTHKIGAIFNERDPSNIAAVIERMLEPETHADLKVHVMKAAEIMSWERESRPYVKLVASLMPAQ